MTIISTPKYYHIYVSKKNKSLNLVCKKPRKGSIYIEEKIYNVFGKKIVSSYLYHKNGFIPLYDININNRLEIYKSILKHF